VLVGREHPVRLAVELVEHGQRLDNRVAIGLFA
jgi:hypothetical protein